MGADIIKIIFSFLLTGIVGVIISSRIQRRNFINQTKISKTEKEVEKIKEIIRRIESYSSLRIFTGRMVVELLASNSPQEKIDSARAEYRKAVFDWNSNLAPIYIELYSLNLYQYARELEKDVHENFIKSHELINEKIFDNNKVNANEIYSAFSTTFKKTRSLSYRILEQANNKWDKILQNESESLNISNIQDANTWVLIQALFHKNPSSLRINRSPTH